MEISIHAPHTGRDRGGPAGHCISRHISIHAPHTGRDRRGQWPLWSCRFRISIHAPHTGRDLADMRTAPKGTYEFQSTRPIRGATCALCHSSNPSSAFQSTRPIRGATHPFSGHLPSRNNFNPRAPYGARHLTPAEGFCRSCISIHAPHTGRDVTTVRQSSKAGIFQSTRPIRGATAGGSIVRPASTISIHAPHTGRDHSSACIIPLAGDGVAISIHAPHTGRDVYVEKSGAHTAAISIHAPHTGRDALREHNEKQPIGISIHAPHTGRDACLDASRPV